MLYLISTPIGNLADLSYRAVSVLQQCDYVLCEDTRHSRLLLTHYNVHVPLKSFHQFKEAKAEDTIIADLKTGKHIGLISDAGTPLISDPGEQIVRRCRKESLIVTHIPGPCAVISSLVLSALPTLPFQFIGFLPKKYEQLREVLVQSLLYRGTTIAYESPHRIEKTLHELTGLSPNTQLSIARELTKLHEECLNGTAPELLQHFQKNIPRGEMVLLISPAPTQNKYADLSLQDLITMLQNDLHLTKKEALKVASQLNNVPKNQLYKQLL